jgi:hypothetical protein
MTDYAKVPRAQEIDENKNVIAGGTTFEIQVLTCTASDMLPINFSELPKAVMFQTRTGATDVEFTWGTSTVGNGANGGYFTLRNSSVLKLDCVATGTYYFRNSAANQGSIVIRLALL